MKFKLSVLSLTIVLFIFCACTEKEISMQNIPDDNDVLRKINQSENDIKPVETGESKENVDTHIQQIAEYFSQQENPSYKLVQPECGELQMIPSDLEYILSFFHDDYDCTKDNIYNYLFSYNRLNCVYPNDYDKVFVSQPLQDSEWGSMKWYLLDVPQKDPLGKFPEISQEIFDENGNVDRYFAWDYYEAAGTPWLEMCIGYNKFSAEYIDWLVKDVWNGKLDHKTFFEFEDGTVLYYHNGYYYTPALAGDRGGGGVYNIHIENLTPLDNNLFKLEYHLTDDINRCDSHNTAIIGLKEKDDGSRFWSIFSIEYNYKGNKFNY